MNLKKTLLASTLFFGSMAANAELVPTDWKSAGDKETLTDTETELVWLKVKNSINMSANEVANEFFEGGQFEGYRFATFYETELLFSNGMLLPGDEKIVVDGSERSFTAYDTYGLVDNLLNGTPYHSTSYKSLFGHVVEGDEIRMFGVKEQDSRDRHQTYLNMYRSPTTYGFDNSFNHVGHFLVKGDEVRPVSASLPGTLGVFALGMAGFVARRRNS